MATHRHRYVSLFKIDGVPIIPPLMTSEKRRQMQKYKELAIQLQRLAKKQPQKPEKLAIEPQCNLLRHGHSHIPQPQTPRKSTNEASTSTSSSSTPSSAPKRDRLNKLRQTDTLVYDNRANSIILTLEGFEEEIEFQSVEIERPQNLDQNDNQISLDVSKSPAKDEQSHTPSKPQPYAAFIPIPSICVNPPTPCVPTNPICENTPPKRLCSSPSLKPDSESNLIRSNSFTLDGPSNALLEHIKNQKLKKSTATQDTVESKAKRVQKVDTKAKAKIPFSTSLTHFPTNTVNFKAKRSPYELKPSSKAKLGRKYKCVKPVTPKKSPQSNSESITSLNSTTKSSCKLDLLKDIEEQHRTRFLELVRQQQAEQKRLQDQFESQQKLLLEQLSARMAKVQMQSPQSTSTVESAQSSPSPSLELESSFPANAPRRRLFAEKDSEDKSATTSARRLEQLKRRYWAATKINAGVRGFLTRRLFRTDYVERIVQTIKDTLIFVLTLHLETSHDASEGNIKLKASLLRQLTSACGTLHSVFVMTTIKERMEIIARDRKYIKAKLMAVKSSPRIIA